MSSTEEKQSDKQPQEKGEDLSRALTKLYRLAYESMQDEYDVNNLKIEYNEIAKEFSEIIKSFTIPTSCKELIVMIETLLSNAKNSYIYGEKKQEIEEKEGKMALIEYCKSDNIDGAILYLLNYKLAGKSIKEIVNYVHSESAGWSSYSFAAIHKVLSNTNRNAWNYKNKDDIQNAFEIEEISYKLSDSEKDKIKKKNKPKEEKRDKYISNIIDSKYSKTIFLIEMFLRENASTTLRSNASGWRVAAKNETVFNQALSTDNIDILRLIFKYGIDIDIETTCTSGGSSMRTDSSSSWKPIHTAIEKNNYELTQLIIKRGANINCYRTNSMSNEYGSRQDRQITALYVICSQLKDNNKMLKLILSIHEQKYNGIPDVNKFNCYITSENKPKDVYKAQKKEAKRRQKEDNKRYREQQKQQQLNGDNNKDKEQKPKPEEEEVEEEDDEDDEDDMDRWDDPRSGYYINPYVNMYNYETTMHVAVKRCDIEMIKLLLIYGGDISLCKIKTERGYGGYRTWYSRKNSKDEKDRFVLMREWYDQFMENYNKTKTLQKYESVKDVYKILDETKCDEKIKNQIKKIFDTKSIWFPDMIDFYPNNMGQALSVIIESLSDGMPIVIINIIIEYFYNIVEQLNVKEADKLVDIKNIKD